MGSPDRGVFALSAGSGMLNGFSRSSLGLICATSLAACCDDALDIWAARWLENRDDGGGSGIGRGRRPCEGESLSSFVAV